MILKNLNNIFKNLQFYKIVLIRLLTICFRKNKEIRLLHLKYNDKYLFENSYIIINYRFRNAIYYRFGNHITTEKEIKIFDLLNFNNEFDLIVYGFFKRKIYHLKFSPEVAIDTNGFRTQFQNFSNPIHFQYIESIEKHPIYIENKKESISIPKISILNKTINFNKSSFNQNDFI